MLGLKRGFLLSPAERRRPLASLRQRETPEFQRSGPISSALTRGSSMRKVLLAGQICVDGELVPIRSVLPGDVCRKLDLDSLGGADLAALIVSCYEDDDHRPLVSEVLARHARENDPAGGGASVVRESAALVREALKILCDDGWDASVYRTKRKGPPHYVKGLAESDPTERALHREWRGSSFELRGRIGEIAGCGYCDAEWAYEVGGPNGDDPAQHEAGCPCPGIGDNPGTSAQSEIAFAWARARREEKVRRLVPALLASRKVDAPFAACTSSATVRAIVDGLPEEVVNSCIFLMQPAALKALVKQVLSEMEA